MGSAHRLGGSLPPRAPWFPPKEFRGWVAFLALVILWFTACADAGIWFARSWDYFFSKANFVSHFWSYFTLGGAVVGLLARGAPNALRSIPTVWLLASLFFQNSATLFPREILPPLEGPSFRVMTLNLGSDTGKRAAALSFLRRRHGLDVLFFQEVAGTESEGDRPALERVLGRRLPYAAWRPQRKGAVQPDGLGIMSRFPLREVRAIVLPPGSVRKGICSDTEALIAKADIQGRTVRLATVHLCPPRMPWNDVWGRDVGFSLSNVWEWLGTLRQYEYARRSQLFFLRLVAEGGVEPFLLGGDLNTTTKSLDILPLARLLHNAFDERGLGFGYTFYLGPFGARVDHIYYSAGLRARSAAVADVDVSDHRPLEAAIEILPSRR